MALGTGGAPAGVVDPAAEGVRPPGPGVEGFAPKRLG